MKNIKYLLYSLNTFGQEKINFPNKKKALPSAEYENFSLVKTHKNNTLVIYLKENSIYRKFSKNEKGVSKIEAENKGLKWYCNKSKKNSKNIIRKFYKTNSFAYIDVKEVMGSKAKSWHSLEKNFYYLKRAIKHYEKFYPKIKKSKIHGDLTLDNIIFKKKDMFIIDWEFFNSKKNFKGYDIVYLILSAACLPYIFNKVFSKKDELLFIKLWKLLIKNKFNKKMLSRPFVYFEKNIQSDIVLKKSLKLSRSKFFPFITPKKFKKTIIKIIDSINYER